MITSINFYDKMRALSELADEYNKDLNVGFEDVKLDVNSEYIIQIYTPKELIRSPVFFSWNTNNVLYPYYYKYELVLIEGIVDDTENRFNQFTGTLILRPFEGFDTEDSPSMKRLGKILRDTEAGMTTCVVGFIGSVYSLPTEAPILSILSRDDYELAKIYRKFEQFKSMQDPDGVDVHPRLVAISLKYDNGVYKSYGVLIDSDAGVDIPEDIFVDKFTVIEDTGKKIPIAVKNGEMADDDTRDFGGFYYTFAFHSLPIEDNEEEEIAQVHFL